MTQINLALSIGQRKVYLDQVGSDGCGDVKELAKCKLLTELILQRLCSCVLRFVF